MKALLLRIGIDTGTDGALAPIFEDGSFEFIPLSERDSKSKEHRTYKNTKGRSGKPFSFYLPTKIENRIMHYDPEFDTFTYGDPSPKRNYLLKLQRNDLLVFYAGLAPFQNFKYPDKALYIIGYFTIDSIIDFNQLPEKEIKTYRQCYANNAHMKRSKSLNNLVIAVGLKKKSNLLEKAISISELKKDKNGRHYHAVSSQMEKRLGISGSIQRSVIPRIIEEKKHITNLSQILNMS